MARHHTPQAISLNEETQQVAVTTAGPECKRTLASTDYNYGYTT